MADNPPAHSGIVPAAFFAINHPRGIKPFPSLSACASSTAVYALREFAISKAITLINIFTEKS